VVVPLGPQCGELRDANEVVAVRREGVVEDGLVGEVEPVARQDLPAGRNQFQLGLEQAVDARRAARGDDPLAGLAGEDELIDIGRGGDLAVGRRVQCDSLSSADADSGCSGRRCERGE
jgi:hypothetical protein